MNFGFYRESRRLWMVVAAVLWVSCLARGDDPPFDLYIKKGDVKTKPVGVRTPPPSTNPYTLKLSTSSSTPAVSSSFTAGTGGGTLSLSGADIGASVVSLQAGSGSVVTNVWSNRVAVVDAEISSDTAIVGCGGGGLGKIYTVNYSLYGPEGATGTLTVCKSEDYNNWTELYTKPNAFPGNYVEQFEDGEYVNQLRIQWSAGSIDKTTDVPDHYIYITLPNVMLLNDNSYPGQNSAQVTADAEMFGEKCMLVIGDEDVAVFSPSGLTSIEGTQAVVIAQGPGGTLLEGQYENYPCDTKGITVVNAMGALLLGDSSGMVVTDQVDSVNLPAYPANTLLTARMPVTGNIEFTAGLVWDPIDMDFNGGSQPFPFTISSLSNQSIQRDSPGPTVSGFGDHSMDVILINAEPSGKYTFETHYSGSGTGDYPQRSLNFYVVDLSMLQGQDLLTNSAAVADTTPEDYTTNEVWLVESNGTAKLSVSAAWDPSDVASNKFAWNLKTLPGGVDPTDWSSSSGDFSMPPTNLTWTYSQPTNRDFLLRGWFMWRGLDSDPHRLLRVVVPHIVIAETNATGCAICREPVRVTLTNAFAPGGIRWRLTPSNVVNGASLSNCTDTSAYVIPGSVAANYRLRAEAIANTNFFSDVPYTTIMVSNMFNYGTAPLPPANGNQSTNEAIILPGGRTASWSIEGNKLGCDFTTCMGSTGIVKMCSSDSYEVETKDKEPCQRFIVLVTSDSIHTNCVIKKNLYVRCPCSQCGIGSGFEPHIGSASFSLNLGVRAEGASAGFLYLNENRLSVTSCTPAALHYTTRAPDIDVREESGALRQIMAPQGLVNIVSNPFNTVISFYAPTNVGALTGNVYQLSGLPISEYKVENPANSITNVSHLKITRTIGASVRVDEYSWDSTTDAWTLSSGNGLRSESRSESWNPAHTLRTRTTSLLDSGGALVHRKTVQEQAFPWGMCLVSSVEDPDGAALTNTVEYYSDPTSNGYSRVKSTLDADGRWSLLFYDNIGRCTNRVENWLDVTSTDMSSARSTITRYSGSDSRPTNTEERINGILVAKTWYTITTNDSNERVETSIRAASQNSEPNDPNNLCSSNVYYAATAGVENAGHLKASYQADGRMASYSYQNGIFHSNETTPSGNYFEPVLEGSSRRTLVTQGTVAHPGGIANRTTQTATITDGYGRSVMTENSVFDGSDYVALDASVSFLDDSGHVIKEARIDRVSSCFVSISESTWGCCGKEWEKDSAGIERSFSYDALDRQDITIKQAGTNLITQRSFDSMGKTLTNSMLAGGLSLTTSSAFDVAGRQTASIDSLGLVTTYSYRNGGRITTTVRPGNATNTTENYLDGQPKLISGNAVTQQSYTNGVNADGTRWSTVYTGPAGASSPIWVRTTLDFLGRTVREERPGYGGAVLTNATVFNTKGQVVRTSATGQADMLYQYNELGEPLASALDVNGNGVVDTNGMDRVSGTDQYYEKNGSNWWQGSLSVGYLADNSAVPLTNSLQKTRLTGLGSSVSGGILTAESQSMDLFGNTTVSSTIVDRNTKMVTQRTDIPFSSNDAVSVSINGVQVSSSSPSVPIPVTYVADALERQIAVVDPRTGTSITHYNALGQVDWTQDAVGNITTYGFDPTTGQQIWMENALSNRVYWAMDVRGNRIKTWGAAVNPESRTYDIYGRQTGLATYRGGTEWEGSSWPTNPGTGDTTLWLYDEATGLLTNKLYPDGKGTAYSYTPNGNMLARIWARGITTTYGLDPATGEMTNTLYSGGSAANVSVSYNRGGLQKQVTDAEGTRTLAYNGLLQLTNETVVGLGMTNSISRQYDSMGRSVGFATLGNNYSVTYNFDGVGRFSSVSSRVFSASSVVKYSYLANSDLPESAGFSANGGTPAMTAMRVYEPQRNLLAGLTNTAGTNLVAGFGYLNDSVGRRTQRKDAYLGVATTTNIFGYNPRSEITDAVMSTNRFAYVFDNIGNRQSSTGSVGEAKGYSTYTANFLNEYSSAVVTGSTRNLTYDFDGNLLQDGTWTNAWDGENRLINVEPISPVNGSQKAEFTYDYMGRRVQKIVSEWNGSAWNVVSTHRFIYDGWNLISETVNREPGTSVTNSFVWGLDISGSLQGAGGIGGLVFARIDATNAWATFDGNGNLMQLVSNTNPTNILAAYEYGPFGDTLKESGTLAGANPWKFSGKYWDKETGLGYWGYRYYSVAWGRWTSRDPAEEDGGLLLYGYCGNEPIQSIDAKGRFTVRNEATLFGGLTIAGITASIQNQFDKYLTDNKVGIRSPLREAMGKHLSKMEFVLRCNNDSECSEDSKKMGYAPRGILQDVAGNALNTTLYVTTPDVLMNPDPRRQLSMPRYSQVKFKQQWNTTAFICYCNVMSIASSSKREPIVVIGEVAVHEAAHLVGWGNYYIDKTDKKFNNMTAPPEWHPFGWNVPEEKDPRISL